ncbi:unnamed protein product [Paramecium sonneborni]|uniref:Uncharacterized protein n=1 Tax=Paramecium sonneborni TaxID=65129 RepID=A0A8S1MYL6_9CILI|nr:unnamed protein product [Paramecium sonneborni]
MSTSRKLQNEYNNCIYKMMYTLSKRCVKAITGELVDHQKFAALIGKQFGILTKLEEERCVQFKFSESLRELSELLGLQGINLNIIEENHDIIWNNQQKQKVQIQQQSKLLELNHKNYNPVKNVSKSIDHKMFKQIGGITRPETELKEAKESRDFSYVKEMKEINQNISKNSFFIQRKQIQTETNGIQKTLEQKEREFLERFRQKLEEH